MEKITGFNFPNFAERIDQGVRLNQFHCILNLPPALQGVIGAAQDFADKFKFQCKASGFPALEMGEIQVPFRGRQLKIAGDRTFADWNVTVIATANQDVYNTILRWSDAIDGLVNADSIPDAQGLNYFGAGSISLLDKNSNVLQTARVEGIWPKSIGEISLDMSSNDTIAEFQVTFSVQWMEFEDVTRNNTTVA